MGGKCDHDRGMLLYGQNKGIPCEDLPNLPNSSRVILKETRQRFNAGVSLTGREVRVVFAELAVSHTFMCA